MPPAPPPPPPRAPSSPSNPANDSPSPSRPSTPQLAALSSQNPLASSIGPGGNRRGGGKGETLDLRALMSDLGVLTGSAVGEGLLKEEKGKEGQFAPAPPPADAYAPKPPSYSLADLPSLPSVEELGREQAVKLAEEWVAATGRVLARAGEELDGGRGEKVRRAEGVERWAGKVGEGLEVA